MMKQALALTALAIAVTVVFPVLASASPDPANAPEISKSMFGPGGSVSDRYGLDRQRKKDEGVPALVGTVTMSVGKVGTIQGGGFEYPGVDKFGGSTSSQGGVYNGGQFTVIPEPGTALLMALGLTTLGIANRRKR